MNYSDDSPVDKNNNITVQHSNKLYVKCNSYIYIYIIHIYHYVLSSLLSHTYDIQESCLYEAPQYKVDYLTVWETKFLEHLSANICSLYVLYKISLAQANFHSPSSKCTRIGERASVGFPDCFTKKTFNAIWVRWQRCGCLVTWFCYHLIVKPGNKTAAPLWPNPYSLGHGGAVVLLPGLISTDNRTRYQDSHTSIQDLIFKWVAVAWFEDRTLW